MASMQHPHKIPPPERLVVLKELHQLANHGRSLRENGRATRPLQSCHPAPHVHALNHTAAGCARQYPPQSTDILFSHAHERNAHAQVWIVDSNIATSLHPDPICLQLEIQDRSRRKGGLRLDITA